MYAASTEVSLLGACVMCGTGPRRQLQTSSNEEAFVAKVNATGTALVYCGYIGGPTNDRGFGIAVDRLGNAYVTGVTASAMPLPPLIGPDITSPQMEVRMPLSRKYVLMGPAWYMRGTSAAIAQTTAMTSRLIALAVPTLLAERFRMRINSRTETALVRYRGRTGPMRAVAMRSSLKSGRTGPAWSMQGTSGEVGLI
jgi:hypothetical protein